MDDGKFTCIISVFIGKNMQLKQTISLRANLDIILRIPDMRIFKMSWNLMISKIPSLLGGMWSRICVEI